MVPSSCVPLDRSLNLSEPDSFLNCCMRLNDSPYSEGWEKRFVQHWAVVITYESLNVEGTMCFYLSFVRPGSSPVCDL